MKILKFRLFEGKEIERDGTLYIQEYDNETKSMVATYKLKEITDTEIIIENRQEWKTKNLITFELQPRPVARYRINIVNLPKNKVEILEENDDIVKLSIPYYIWKKWDSELKILKLEDAENYRWRRS